MLARSLLAVSLAIAHSGLTVAAAASVAHAGGSLATAAVAPAAAGLPVVGAPHCPCADPSLCQPLTLVHEREVFGFSIVRQASYDRYDWSQVTTVAWNDDPQLVCAAHAAGARVVLSAAAATASPAVYANRTARAAWLAEQLRYSQQHFLDGINFDLEEPLALGDPLAAEYAAFVAEAAAAFHAAVPGSQVSVDVPWSPYGVDGRWYDWRGLAAAADLLFVMAYDMQSQIWGRCVASANSPAALVRRGVEGWLAIGVPRSKLVLGLPWYGYLYPCTNAAYAAGQETVCQLPAVPFQGCPCSDAAGSQLCYSDIRAALRRSARAAGNPLDTHAAQASVAARAVAGEAPAAAEQASPPAAAAATAAAAAGGADAAAAGQLPAARGPPGGAALQVAGQPLSTQPKQRRLVCAAPAVDAAQRSPFARCRLDSDPPGFARFQVWYDDPASLTEKYALAAELGLRGVGMWHLDCLSAQTVDDREDAAAMWAALQAFMGPRQQARLERGSAGADASVGLAAS